MLIHTGGRQRTRSEHESLLRTCGFRLERIVATASDVSIIEAVCGLANRLGLRVVVEGIETEEQRQEVKVLGAELAQGYLFGRPESLDNLMPRIQRAA